MKRSSLGAALILAAASLNAPAQPWGPELRINSMTTATQAYPSVAGISTSEFVVVWIQGNDTIRGQRMNMLSGAPAGAEFAVSSVAEAVLPPAVGTDIAGVFVVSWSADNDDPSGWDVRARRFNWSGEPLGNEFRANTDTVGEQMRPHVATFGNRRFVVAWHDQFLANHPDVEAQLIAPTGAPDGAELRVNTVTTERQQFPDVAGSHNQGFVTVWADGRSGPLFVAAQRYGSDGLPVAALRVSDYTSTEQTAASVASDSEGNFVVVWEDSARDGDLRGIFGRRFSASGSPLGPEFRVNTTTAGSQVNPEIAVDWGGSFLVAWESPDGAGQGVYAQEFTPAGIPRGGELRVNTYTSGDQKDVEVSTGYRNFVVVWTGVDGSDRGIYAQRFCFKGDVDGDGVRSVSDVLYMINRLFAGGPPPFTYCPSVNGDEVLNVSDVLYMINHLFAGGPAPV